jgi:hypothetical protein
VRPDPLAARAPAQGLLDLILLLLAELGLEFSILPPARAPQVPGAAVRTPHRHNHEMPAGRAAHHAVGMKTELPPVQIHAILSRAPEGVQTKLVRVGGCQVA